MIRQDFNKGWEFCKTDTITNGSKWNQVEIPHDWSILYPFQEKNETGRNGGYAEYGIGWYRKEFTYSIRENQKVFLEFEGIMMNSEVYLNGTLIGKRPNGYVNQFYDISKFLVDGTNDVLVKTDTSQQPNSRWYTGAGIYRKVWLVETEKVYIEYNSVQLLKTFLKDDTAFLDIKATIINENFEAYDFVLKTTIYNEKDEAVACEIANSTAMPTSRATLITGEKNVKQRLTVYSPYLWSPENPYLYKMETVMLYNDVEIDRYSTKIGIKSIVLDSDKGFILNGKAVKFKGVCLHHDYGSLGAAFYEKAWERRLIALKEIGCNSIRTSHNQPAEGLLDLCDRLGFMVMDEAFDEWECAKVVQYGYSKYFEEWAERDLRALIRRDRNHPSIVMWSIANEIWDIYSNSGKINIEKLTYFIKQEDSTRPVVASGINMYSKDLEMIDTHYNALFNEVNKEKNLRENFENSNAISSTDFYTPDGIVRFAIEKEDKPVKSLIISGESSPFPDEYIKCRDYDYVIGEFLWTGFDYLGEANIGSNSCRHWPCHGAHCGLFDLSNNLKPQGYFRKALWDEQPMVYLACSIDEWEKESLDLWGWNDLVVSHWNFENGKKVNVACYSNCDTVELFLNDQSLGEKRINGDADYDVNKTTLGNSRLLPVRPCWDVPFESGVLKAVGKFKGKPKCEYVLTTASEAVEIKMTSDKISLKADNEDIVFIYVQIVDKNGISVPNDETRISCTVLGCGKLIGIETANLDDPNNYNTYEKKLYDGKCLIMVKATDNEGEIRISVKAKKLNLSKDIVITSNRADEKTLH